MEKIIHKNVLIAIRVKKFKKGSVPLTDPTESLQLIAYKHREGKYTKPHIHKPKKRVTSKLQECLVVIKGKIKVDLYTPDKKFFKYIYLSAGEAVMLTNGGHGVHVLKDSEIIEIKNGPFIEDKVMIDL